MTIDKKIRDETSWHDINREAAKISAFSSAKSVKYKYLTGREILPFGSSQMIEQSKFTYSPLRKTFEKWAKTIKDQPDKQVKASKVLKSEDQQLIVLDASPEDQLNGETRIKLRKSKELKQ